MEKYPYIRAWGRMMGSFNYYINDQIALAESENAPEGAIYKGADGWHTVDAIQDQDTKKYIQKLADIK